MSDNVGRKAINRMYRIYQKLAIVGVLLMCVTLNSFSQKCTKFIDNQSKTVNTKGISAVVMGKPIEVGATSVSTLHREVSDKLQKLDLLQYNICEQLKNIKTDFMREKLQAQYSNLMMRMMELVENGGKQVSANHVAELIGNGKTKNELAPEPQKEDVESAPTITDNNSNVNNNTNSASNTNNTNNSNTNTSNSAGNVPASILDDDDMDIDITFPCEEFISSSGTIRAFGMETSMDAQIAKRVARTVALEELASKVEITIKTVTVDYYIRTQKQLDEDLAKRIEGRTVTVVKQTLRGYSTVCEKYRQNKSTKKYSCYITLELSKDDVVKPVYDDLIKEPELNNALPSYDKFKETFDEIMSDYEKSF